MGIPKETRNKWRSEAQHGAVRQTRILEAERNGEYIQMGTAPSLFFLARKHANTSVITGDSAKNQSPSFREKGPKR